MAAALGRNMNRIRSSDWNTLALWALGLALGVAALLWVLRAESARQLHGSAESAGLKWAHFAERTVPNLDQVLAGRGVTDQAREQLLRLRKVDAVFRFKLFDPEGNLMLVSDDLERRDLGSWKAASEGIGRHHEGGKKDHIRTQVLAGANHVDLIRSQRIDRPAVYSETYVPVWRDGQVAGVVEVYVDQVAEDRAISGAFFRVAAAVAVFLMMVLLTAGVMLFNYLQRQRQAEERVRYLALHDTLSGALNRGSFNDAVAKAIWRCEAGGPGLSVLCVDLDRFKEVNDTLGHAAGDEVLRLVTQRLRDAVREGDPVARLGGDEFAVLLPGVTTAADITPLAQRIVSLLAQPYEVGGGQRVCCGGSVGVAVYGVDATDQADLLHKADLALYQAKAAGRGTVSFFDSAVEETLKGRRELTNDLRTALGTERLSLHYQPLHDAGSGTLTGYEALLRWNHPERGEVPPMEFIPLAEETGLIDALGQWVLHRACADAATWPDPLTVAINLSPAQLVSSGLVSMVRTELANSGLPAHRLELEITESMLMANTERVLSQLHELSAMGVSIAMDDFGTGYSSLAYLWKFPFNKVKIDRAFTQNLDNDPKVGVIVGSIISLAHSLNIRVNAEGVETAGQMAALKAQGCDELQGFFLGRPGPMGGLAYSRDEVQLAQGGAHSAVPKVQELATVA